MKVILISTLAILLTSCQEERDLSSYLGKCFKVGDKGSLLIEGVLNENANTSHNVGILYYDPSYDQDYQRDTASVWGILNFREPMEKCPQELTNSKIKKYDWNNYKMIVKTIN